MKIILIILLLFPCFVNASVVINEIAWMGTETSYNDEWIKLYNNGDDVNLDEWVLKADDGSLEINLEGIIPAKGFYLLERSDDETVPGVTANLIYKGSLDNKGENLKLYNNSGALIDQVDCQDGWFAGDNKTKETMKKVGDNWQTGQEPIETPKTENSIREELPKPEPEKATPISYPSSIIFNEILPSPEGADSENEWIEIYNQNNFEVDLSGWIIKDTIGSTKSYTLSTTISPHGYLLLKRPETKITLNNDNDGLVLLNPNKKTVDSVSFGKVPQNQSYSKISSSWSWTTTLTPNSKNIITRNSEQRTVNNEQNPSEDKFKTGSIENSPQRIKLVDDLEKTSKSRVFSIAFIIALLSSISFLIIKNNLKNFWY